MSQWIYKVGLSEDEVSEEALIRSGLKFEKVSPRERILSVAHEALDKPYIYGASISRDAPVAFDCSSLTGYAYVLAGFSIPRISVEQFLYGIPIEERELEPGDLIFTKGRKPYFYKETPDGVGHVGIYVGDGYVIHASGPSFANKVIKEKWHDSPQFSSAELRGFRRLIDNEAPRYVIEIPEDRPDLRIKENLIQFLR